MKIDFIDSISPIPAAQWQRLNNCESPFLQQSFFSALETSHSAVEANGWIPHHMLVHGENEQQLKAILPLYIKQHSWGEFVFDWAWADAFERNGYAYYPKLVSTIPFTPVSGDKLLSNDISQYEVMQSLTEHCQQQDFNSWHLLFCPATDQLPDNVFLRHTVQFQWFNRDYLDFDHFLATFTARKRKNTRKERLSIAAQGLTIQRLSADEITEHELDFFYLTYQLTYAKRGHTPHLTKAFFQQIIADQASNVLLVIASYQKKYVAAAWFFVDQHQLYGRYWGCTEYFPNLHFELCYYQGIEFCIEHKLQGFNPGTQGEHKIQRGFEPILTHSYHWIKQVEFRPAIKAFCTQERQELRAYQQQCRQALPFKNAD